MDSTPPTSTSDASPVSIAREACIAASSEEPQRRLTVAPVTEVGRPASSTAMRATLRLSSPAPLALPNSTSSMRAGSSAGARPTSARTACAARSAGLTPALLLQRAEIEAVVLEDRTREHVERRVRAGLLEQNTVDLLHDLGVG